MATGCGKRPSRMDHIRDWPGVLKSACSQLGKTPRLLLQTESGLLLDETYAPYFILRRQLKNLAGVVGDVVVLLERRRHENIVGLSRIAFEARISITATLARPEYASEKLLAGINEAIAEIDELIACPPTGGPHDSRWLREERSRLAAIQEGFAEVRRRQWKVKEAAELGGLADQYRKRYPLLSHAAHSTPKGLATKSDERIVALSAVNLIEDALETVAACLFCKDPQSGERRPAISNFKEVIPVFEVQHQQYCELRVRSNYLANALSLAD